MVNTKRSEYYFMSMLLFYRYLMNINISVIAVFVTVIISRGHGYSVKESNMEFPRKGNRDLKFRYDALIRSDLTQSGCDDAFVSKLFP